MSSNSSIYITWLYILPTKQLIVNQNASGIHTLHEKIHLVHMSFLFTDINSNLNGANDHMIQSEADIGTIVNDEDGFTTNHITAVIAQITEALIIMTVTNICFN